MARLLVPIAGLLHFGVLGASALVPKVLDWRTELRDTSTLTRHVVWTHGVFIVLVILGFGAVSLFLHEDLTSGSALGRSVCAFIALFWGARLLLQVLLFDPSPHLCKRWLWLSHHGLTLMFAYFTLVYGWFALAPEVRDASEVIALLLRLAAVGQAAVGLLNLSLPVVLRWRPVLRELPLLPRQVFYVHSLFVSVTLWIFAVLTWQFSAAMAEGRDPLAAWLAGGIGVFWALRALVQIAYYSPRHWLGKARETAAHVVLVLVYGGMGAVYLLAARGA